MALKFCDPVYRSLGAAAPPPGAGEGAREYRGRLLGEFGLYRYEILAPRGRVVPIFFEGVQLRLPALQLRDLLGDVWGNRHHLTPLLAAVAVCALAR
jgi:hypothetical protein